MHPADTGRLRAVGRDEMPPERSGDALEGVAKLAARLFGVSVAFVSVVGADRHWLHSAVGLRGEGTRGLDVSVCARTIASEGAFVVEDLAEDERVSEGPLPVKRLTAEEGETGSRADPLRFFAGVPLETTAGDRIGTLCVLDSRPQAPSEDLIGHLERLASMAVAELESRRRRLEKQEAEKALRRSEELHESLFEGAGSAILVCDPDGQIQRVNEKARRLLGDDLVGRSIFDLQEAPRSVVQRRLLRALKEGEALSTVLECSRGDGETLWCELEATAVEIGSETLLRVVLRDVTERHRRQQELRRKREALEAIFEHAPVPIAFFGEDGSFNAVNRAFEDVLGWTRDEITAHQRFMEELFAEAEAKERALRFVEQSDETWREFWVRSKSGEEIPLLASVTKLDDGRRVGVALDLRKRKRHERRLEQAQRLAGLGYWERDLRSGALTWSEETRRIFGWSDEKPATYEAFMSAVHDEDRAQLRAAQKATIAGEGPLDLEYRIRRPSGETRIVREWGECRRTQGGGTPSTLMGAVLDVTERVRHRQELTEAKEKAEEAARAKSALLRNINHEFRTPLTAIVSFADLLRNDPSLTANFAERIYRGGKRLERTLNTVMDFAELEGGEVDPAPEPFDVREAVLAAAEDYRPDAERKGLSLGVDVPGRPVQATVDQHLTERICVHLLSNAVKFTEEGKVAIRVEDPDEDVVIRVEDTGVGIDPAILPEVFEEFRQGSVGNSRKFEGNGLGLTVTKGFARQMGGTVEIESTPRKGTRVTVRLPSDGGGVGKL